MAYQVFLHISLLIFLRHHLTYAHQYKSNTQRTSSPFEFLNHLSGSLRKGDKVEAIHRLKKQLMHLGYLNKRSYHDNNIFDDPLESAVKKNQKFFGLNVTGVLDTSTISSLRRPRCGVLDFFAPGTNPTALSSLYAFFYGKPKWKKTSLKYHFTKKVPKSFNQPIGEALLEWQSVTKFKFTLGSNHFYQRADILISFERGKHDCPDIFSPDDSSMAHVYHAPNGYLHSNAEKKWASNRNRNAYDIKTITVLHEFGHVLGLARSNVPTAIMYPYISLGEIKGLHQDNIKGIKALYGF